MTYKDKYLKLFIRFVKELNLSKEITYDSIDGDYGLLKTLNKSVPTTFAIKFFSINGIETYHKNLNNIKLWEDNICNEFIKDFKIFLDNDKSITNALRLIFNYVLYSPNTEMNNLFFVNYVQRVTDEEQFDLSKFYDRII